MKKLAFLAVLSIWLAIPAFSQNSQSYTLTVLPAPCVISITSNSLPQAQATVPYSFQFQATSSGNCALPLVWSVSTATGQTGLPPGLTLSSVGVLSGTIPATYCTGNACPSASFTITVKDSTGQALLKRNVEGNKIVAVQIH